MSLLPSGSLGGRDDRQRYESRLHVSGHGAGTYCVRSGELLGRTHFFKTSIQLRLMPAVMADSVNTASRVCGATARLVSNHEEQSEARRRRHDVTWIWKP